MSNWHREDMHGNKIIVNGLDVILQLSGGERRKIAFIDSVGKQLVMYHNSQKHLMRKINGYGFNEQILKFSTTSKYVLLILDGRSQKKNRMQEVKKEGQYLNFKQQGFELQLFIPMSLITEYKL